MRGLEVVEILKKPFHRRSVSAETNALGPKIAKALKIGEYCDIPNLLNQVSKISDSIIFLSIHKNWIDVGFPTYLIKANKTFSSQQSGKYIISCLKMILM